MVILSSLFSYDENTINTFVQSLNQTGFTGKKFMVTYHSSKKVKEFLAKNGWVVVESDLNDIPIVCKRFDDFSKIIEESNFNEQILISDCRDVYFYINPENIQNKDLYIAPDGLYPLKDHIWASKEMKNHYPSDFSSLEEKFHLCAGVFYGNKDKVLELCKKTYEYIFKSKLYDKNNTKKETVADQMALNIVAYNNLNYKLDINNTVINMTETFWDETITYFIYHQYDRVGNFFNKLSEKTNKLI